MRGATRAARVAHGARRAALRSPPCPCRKRDASQLRPNAAQTSSRPAIMSASKQRRPARRNSGLAVVAAAELASARKILAKWFSPSDLSSETFKGSGKARETAPLKPKAWLQQDTHASQSTPCSARSKLKDRALQPRCHLNAIDAAQKFRKQLGDITCVQPLQPSTHSSGRERSHGRRRQGPE